MTREIKFRYLFKKGDNSYIVREFTLEEIEGMDPSVPFCFSKSRGVDLTCFNQPKYRLQCTGLKDKNSKEIYEGDIVYIAGWGNYLVDDIDASYQDLVSAIVENDMGEILGNMYENSELV